MQFGETSRSRTPIGRVQSAGTSYQTRRSQLPICSTRVARLACYLQADRLPRLRAVPAYLLAEDVDPTSRMCRMINERLYALFEYHRFVSEVPGADATWQQRAASRTSLMPAHPCTCRCGVVPSESPAGSASNALPPWRC